MKMMNCMDKSALTAEVKKPGVVITRQVFFYIRNIVSIPRIFIASACITVVSGVSFPPCLSYRLAF
jgi:hypothetical protein